MSSNTFDSIGKVVFDYGPIMLRREHRDWYQLTTKKSEEFILGRGAYPVLPCQAVVVNWCLAASLPTPPTHLCRGWGGSSKSTRLYAGSGAPLEEAQTQKSNKNSQGQNQHLPRIVDVGGEVVMH